MCYSSRQRRVPWSPEGPAGPTQCVFLKLRGPEAPVPSALVSPRGSRTRLNCYRSALSLEPRSCTVPYSYTRFIPNTTKIREDLHLRGPLYRLKLQIYRLYDTMKDYAGSRARQRSEALLRAERSLVHVHAAVMGEAVYMDTVRTVLNAERPVRLCRVSASMQPLRPRCEDELQGLGSRQFSCAEQHCIIWPTSLPRRCASQL